MPDHPAILALDSATTDALSIRAKALVFADPASQALLRTLERVSPSEAPVLVIGETGTGKELVARYIHQLSGRNGPFLAVNCGAISEQLAESELFGHEAGSFTGATGKREGWFEAANGGTLFLDEIGDLPLHLQVKLLRVLQEREVVRSGARKPIPVDVRLVAATNVDLGEAVSAGHFRLDLYYRLDIAQLHLPPLRQRTGDILPLAEYFLNLYSKRLKLPLPLLSAATQEALIQYPWPGNIRELENVVHFALLVASDDEIRPEHLKLSGGLAAQLLGNKITEPQNPWQRIDGVLNSLFEHGEANLYDDLEHRIIDAAYKYSSNNQVRTAALLGISRNVLRTILKKHGYISDSFHEYRPEKIA